MIDTKQRNREIVLLRDRGKTYHQIGTRYNLSRERVRQLYEKEKLKMKSEKMHMGALNGEYPFTFYDALLEVCDTEPQATRVYRCLRRAGILTKIEKNNDSLDSYSDELLLDIKNFGSKSLYFARKANEVYQKYKDD